MKYFYYLILFFLFSFCNKTNEVTLIDNNLKILFIGNSLTYTNDLPGLVKEIAAQDNVNISYDLLLFPNYSLEDHWNEGKVQTEIGKNKYDYIIAQQGPSALPDSRALLLDYSTRLAEVCSRNSSIFALYMVWPSKSRSFDLDNVIYSYTYCAEKTNSLLCPAGLAWKYAWEADPSLPLYSADDFHPSISGSVLAAFTIYGSLKKKNNFDFIQYKQLSFKNEITESRFTALKTAALKALGK